MAECIKLLSSSFLLAVEKPGALEINKTLHLDFLTISIFMLMRLLRREGT